jgi:DNA-binding NarL/FixJ family response regulator
VVEDQAATLKNLISLLSRSSKLEIAGGVKSAEEAMRFLDDTNILPDVVLCDIGLPKLSGIELCRWVKVKYPAVEMLMLTVMDDPDQAFEAVKQGAAGYLLKGVESQKLIEAILDVYAGGSVIQPSLARQLLRNFQSGAAKSASKQPESYRRSLTERELECLQMIGKGLSNTEAADVMGLSRATIRTHLEHIYQKLDVCNRVEAVTEGLRQGLIGI